MTNGVLNQTTLQPSGADAASLKSLLGLGLGLLVSILVATNTILIKQISNSKVHYAVNMIFPSYLGMPMTVAFSLVVFFWGVGGERPAELYETNWTVFWQCVAAIGSGLGALSFPAYYDHWAQVQTGPVLAPPNNRCAVLVYPAVDYLGDIRQLFEHPGRAVDFPSHVLCHPV